MHRLKVKGWKKILHTNANKQKSEVALLMADKEDFKTKSKDKERHLVMIEASIQRIYLLAWLNTGAPK